VAGVDQVGLGARPDSVNGCLPPVEVT